MSTNHEGLTTTLFLGKPRTWRERLLSWPWRPFAAHDTVIFEGRLRSIFIDRIDDEMITTATFAGLDKRSGE